MGQDGQRPGGGLDGDVAAEEQGRAQPYRGHPQGNRQTVLDMDAEQGEPQAARNGEQGRVDLHGFT